MFKRILSVPALLAMAVPAWGYSLNVNTFSVDEGGGTQPVEIEFQYEDGDLGGSCVVDVTATVQETDEVFFAPATANEDFVPVTETFTMSVSSDFPSDTATLDVEILDDELQEPYEQFGVDLTVSPNDCGGGDLSGLDGERQVGLNDDGDTGSLTVSVDQTSMVVNESDGTAEIGVSITETERLGAGYGASIFWELTDGTAAAGSDYDGPTSGSVFLDDENPNGTVSVPLLADGEPEPQEDFQFTIVNVGAGFPDETNIEDTRVQDDTTTVSITDADSSRIKFSEAETNVSSDEGEVVLTLVRTGDTSGAVSVDYATEDGSATAGEDYAAATGSVSWAEGDSSEKTITIDLLDPAQDEDFTVALSNAQGDAFIGTPGEALITLAAPRQRDISGISTLTPNQQQLAGWFDETCPRIAALDERTAEQDDLVEICGALRGADDDASVREALDAVNPEELMVSTINALRLTGLQHGNLGQRLNALRNGATGVDLTGLNVEVDGQQIAGTALQEMFDGITGGGASADEGHIAGNWGMFVNGRIATGDKDGNAYESGFDFDLWSVTMGADYRIKPNLIVGLSAGFGSVESDYDGNAGELDIDSWNGAAYLTYFQEESFYFDALATYGENDYDSVRNIAFDTGVLQVNRLARGSTDGTQYSVGIGSGWDFSRGGFTFGPHFGSYYYDVEVDGFSETGADGLDVMIDDQTSESLTVNAGAHVSYAWLTDWGVLVPNAKVDWVHEFEDGRDTLSFRFANDPFTGNTNDPSPTITLRSDRPDENYMIWSVGMSGQFVYGLSAFVNYQAHAAYEDVDMSEWSFGARWEKTF
ncbi:MAG: autotransporter domain-containing protein [Pseudomonadota bacterium]